VNKWDLSSFSNERVRRFLRRNSSDAALSLVVRIFKTLRYFRIFQLTFLPDFCLKEQTNKLNKLADSYRLNLQFIMGK